MQSCSKIVVFGGRTIEKIRFFLAEHKLHLRAMDRKQAKTKKGESYSLSSLFQQDSANSMNFEICSS